MPNNCNQQSILRQRFQDLPVLSHKLKILADIVIVARVQPRTSKGITDLFLPITSNTFSVFVLYRRKLTLAMQATQKLCRGDCSYPNKFAAALDAKTTASYYTTKVSFVNGINQTTHTTN